MLSRRKTWWLTVLLCCLVGCSNGNVSSGDRVLVSKFDYDSGIGEPHRFDVVVFKYPKGPIENGVPKNYIKRLLGLPGQILAIFFGQLFFYTPLPGERPRWNPQMDDVDNPLFNKYDLWQKDLFIENKMYDLTHTDDPGSRKLFTTPGKFQIIRKPPEVMMSMRRIVYDNDYPAMDLVDVLPPRWKPAENSGWASDKSNGFVHAAAKKNGVDWLRYRHILRPWTGPATPDRKPELITDMMDYNAGTPSLTNPITQCNWVGDLMVECDLTVNKAEGEFWLELSRGGSRFQASFDLATGKCTLFKMDKHGKQTELAQADTRVKSTGHFTFRLANFDARLAVWVDNDLPFGDGKDYPPPNIRSEGEDEKSLSEEDLNERRGPTEYNDLEPASIGNRGAQVHVAHLRLWRDTYYLVVAPQPDIGLSQDDWCNPSQWSRIRGIRSLDEDRGGMPFKTMYVQPGHYLCLGDNSPASSDSREWGVVPQRLMLGRALMVYFPIDRAGPIR